MVHAQPYGPADGFAARWAGSFKRMVILLLLLSAIFGYLAIDAYSLGKPARGVPYEMEAKVRGENLDGVSLVEQRKRQAWHRSHGVGKPADLVWIWAILCGACFALAVVAYE